MTHLLPRAPFRLLAHLTAVLSIVGLFSAVGATAATYETVDTFGGTPTPPASGEEWPEDVQLGGAAGMAINRTGAGGVPKGTIFVAVTRVFTGGDSTKPQLAPGVARYAPDGTFEETFTDLGRCGPIVPGSPVCGSRPSGGAGVDVDIDQTTGNIYLINTEDGGVKPPITLFAPDGSDVIDQFGAIAKFGETATESPDRIHGGPVGIAVNDDGEVYVYDEDTSSDFYKRLMVFKPQAPGDYEHYVYAGKENDIGGTFAFSPKPQAPVLDNAGNIFSGGDGFIAKYDLSVSRTTPVCTFTVGSGITAFTVNPATGEVFYYSSANRKLHLLNPCNAQGKFVETEPAFKAVPERDFLSALAFDPTRVFEEGTPPGVLYGVAPNGDNTGGGGDPKQSALGYVFSRPPNLTPVVESESVSNVRTTSAVLRALINPKGSLTSYSFQYIDQASWEANDPSERFAGATEAPVGGAVLGSGQIPLLATAAVSGLAPGLTYHYRAVATSAQGSANGADQVFRTFVLVPAGLPDGRAYELVTPAQKNGGEPIPLQPGLGSCQGCKPGLAINTRFPVEVSPDGDSLAYMSQPFRLNTGPTEYDQAISRRTASGWQAIGIGPPGIGTGEPFAALDLDTEMKRAIISVNNPALAPEAPRDFVNLFTQATNDPLALEPFLKATPPHRDSTGSNIFRLRYAGASTDLSRVFFIANDALTPATAVAPAPEVGALNEFNLYEWSEGELHLVNVFPGNASTAPGADFGAPRLDNNHAPILDHVVSEDGSRVFWRDAAGQVFVREDAETTREIPVAGQFLSASADGSKVLLSNGEIYDLETSTTTDLTEGAAGFLGLAGRTDDLSRLYFVATSVLDESSNGQGDAAQAGKPNLYAWAEGSARFIATLDIKDNSGFSGDWEAAPIQRTAEASPNGHVLAFQSQAPLTGQETIGACPTVTTSQGPCPMVYVYDSDRESLTCASCNSTGSLALGYSVLPTTPPTGSTNLAQPRFVSDSGRVFFDSQDSLSPHDTNNGVEDVYQYEPDGTGGCTEEGGCVSLISAGHEPVDSNFLAADATGKNVFFISRDRLVLKDRDDLLDVYVAREGGGFSSETEVGRGECQGEACQAPYAPPSDPTPASLNYDGAGNVNEKPPARKHKKHHKKKHKKKKHAKKHSGGKHNRGGAK